MACFVDWNYVLQGGKIVADVLSAAAWPIAAAWIATRFKEPISRAIDRARKFSAMGIDADLPIAQAEAVADAIPESVVPARTVPAEPPYDPLLTPMDEDYLKRANTEDLSPEQRMKWLARIASLNFEAWRHENHYRVIFGSQVGFLKVLNHQGPQDESAAKRWYEFGGLKTEAFQFDGWLQFLLTSHDIVRRDDGKFAITEAGRRFLVWLTSNSIPDNKPY